MLILIGNLVLQLDFASRRSASRKSWFFWVDAWGRRVKQPKRVLFLWLVG